MVVWVILHWKAICMMLDAIGSIASAVFSVWATVTVLRIAKESRSWKEIQYSREVLWKEQQDKIRAYLEFCAGDFLGGVDDDEHRRCFNAWSKVSVIFRSSQPVQEVQKRFHAMKPRWDVKEVNALGDELTMAMTVVILQDDRVLRDLPDARIHVASSDNVQLLKGDRYGEVD